MDEKQGKMDQYQGKMDENQGKIVKYSKPYNHGIICTNFTVG